ncbi:MAG TPA: hypothetical protein VH062_13210 [Polyangiaceae bacterium]|jgi:hypothetical protein|nr:hypothetical protein [Polyangiaceae bacterium]
MKAYGSAEVLPAVSSTEHAIGVRDGRRWSGRAVAANAVLGADLGRRENVRWPGAVAPFEAWTGTDRVAIADFSFDGLGIVLPPGKWPGGINLELELRTARLPFARVVLEVTHATPSNSGSLLGGKLTESLPIRSGIELPGMGDSVEVKDSAVRRTLLSRLGRARAAALVHSSRDAASLGSIRTVTLDGPTPLLTVAVDDLDLEVNERVVLDVTLFGGSFSVRGVAARVESDQLTVDVTAIYSVGRREHERVRLKERQATLEWRHPLDPSCWVSTPVVDLSPRGLGVVLSAVPRLLLPPPSVPLLLRLGGVQIPILAEVRHTAVEADGAVRVGLRIAAQIASDAAYLARACQAARFPMLVPRAQIASESVDDLLRSSGYLALRDRTDPAPGWHAPGANEQLTVDLVYQGNAGKPVAHGSYLRLYPNTWLFHQLATIGFRRASAAYPLYVQAAEWALALSDEQVYGLSYFDQGKSWHQTMLGEFQSWLGSDSLSSITSLDRLERLSTPVPQPPPTRALTREALPSEHAFVSCLARSFLPGLVADGLCITESTVSTQDLCSQHALAGLERQRTALVVEIDGRLEAAALCETGSRTLSLFNILNIAHVFVRTDSAPNRSREAQGALLRGVLEFYRARGVTDPLVATPHGSVWFPEDAGLTITESMGCWVASREGLKQWKNYIHFALGSFHHRPSRKTEPSTSPGSVDRSLGVST